MTGSTISSTSMIKYYISATSSIQIKNPSFEEIKQCFEANDLPVGPNGEIISIAYTLGNNIMMKK